MNNAIELSHVTKTYPTFALRDLSLTLPTGCIMGLVGENGAGKSTTLRLIMNTITRDSGEITVLGQDNRSDAFRELKNDIGVVLDEAYFPEVLNPRQVGQVMAQTYTRWDEDTYAGYVDRFALPWKQRFKDFSRGMKMKLAIAVALSHSPRLLLLDEATSGLDPMIRDEILETFSEFTRDENHSVLLSSHIVSDLEKISRLHRLPPPGTTGAVRGEGRPAGRLRHRQMHPGTAFRPAGGGGAGDGAIPLRRPGPGAAGAGLPCLFPRAAHFGGYHFVSGERRRTTMKGLLLKDVYVLTAQMRFFLVLILLFAVIPSYSMSGFAIIYAAMLPYTSIAYDERSKWDQLAGMMPYSTRQVVLSKFMLGYLCVAIATAVSLLSALVIPGGKASPSSLLTAACVALTIMAVTLPFMLRFGVERGRMLFILVIVAAACGSMTAMETINESGAALPQVLTLGAPVLAVAANLISLPISFRAYARRSF